MSTPREPPTSLDRFAMAAGLTVLGITWPVLQLLAENAEFFLARDSTRLEIVLLTLALLVMVPTVIGALAALPGRPGRVLGAGLIFLTSTTLAHLYLNRLPVPWWVVAVLAVVSGIAVVLIFQRWAAVRFIGRYLLAAPLVLLGVLFFLTPAGDLVRDRGAATGSPVVVDDPKPIVMIVFDEFPVASIMDGEGNLRAERYPGFARLAQDGVWYRNAITVEQQTEHSIPAMITGIVPDQSLTPFAGHYPDNLFTALSAAYLLRVNETITGLCPARLCATEPGSEVPLTDDVLVVAGHVLLPRTLVETLPPIDQTWGDFTYVPDDFDVVAEFQERLQTDRREDLTALVEDIAGYDADQPPFFFLHALVPHHPWQYLPDGREYPLIVQLNPASYQGGWIDDEFLVAQGMQRHLLQVGYVDHALTQVITALEGAGLYEEAIVVVVADHGIAIKPGVEHQRRITETTIGEIAAIPLFIKAPGLEAGTIDDRRALTIDIAPTIADVIDATLGWEVDGASLLGQLPTRTETTTVGPDGTVTFGVDGVEKFEVATRIEDLFPDGDPWSLRPSDSPDIVGERVTISTLEDSDLTVRLRSAELYQDVDTTGDMIPVRLSGTLYGPAGGDELLVVSVNGVIGAITMPYEEDGAYSFLAMVRPGLFIDGSNQIDILEIGPDSVLLHIEPT
ncbi:MAG: sulfatase-like hydrolase/transferase [Actinobacteria bacterium]|nr:sulfatase-like hydrolase/transferase [Actinomycetota bacterium]